MVCFGTFWFGFADVERFVVVDLLSRAPKEMKLDRFGGSSLEMRIIGQDKGSMIIDETNTARC